VAALIECRFARKALPSDIDLNRSTGCPTGLEMARQIAAEPMLAALRRLVCCSTH
jgi:hypothetical protein